MARGPLLDHLQMVAVQVLGIVVSLGDAMVRVVPKSVPPAATRAATYATVAYLALSVVSSMAHVFAMVALVAALSWIMRRVRGRRA